MSSHDDTCSIDIGMCIQREDFSANPMDHDEFVVKRFAKAGWSWDDVAKVKANPDAPGPYRILVGAGFDATNKSPSYGWDYEDTADGGWYSLKELALEKGDEIKMIYDYGERDEFIVQVQDVKQSVPVLPQVTLYGHETRVNLVRKGNSKMRKQYDDGSSRPY